MTTLVFIIKHQQTTMSAFKKQKTFSSSEDLRKHERIWKSIRVTKGTRLWKITAELPEDMAMPATKRMRANPEYFGKMVSGLEQVMINLPHETEKCVWKSFDEILYYEFENGVDQRPEDLESDSECEWE